MAQGMSRPGGDSDTQNRMTARYVLRDHLAQISSTHSKRWTQTPDRAQAARDLLNGDLVAPIPEAFGKSGIDIGAFRVDLPDKYLVAYHQRNVLSKAEPRVKRWPRGDSQAAKLESTKLEQIMQAVMDDRFPWREAADVILNEGVALAITLHDTAAMAQTPSLYEADGKTVRARYARNAAGKTKAEAPKDWRVSLKASAKEHERDKRELASRRIPLQMEVLGPRSFIPVFGPGLCLDAVLVERYWTTTEVLRRKWLWEGMDDHLSPDGSAVDGYTDDSHGGVGQIKVVELYAVDYQDDGPHPYVAYSIGSKKVYKRDGSDIVDALIDLREEYGLTRLPAVLKWGCHWATAEYDKRAMPFPIPFAQSQRAVDAILTGIVVQTWWRGFPTLLESPPKDGSPDFGRLAETDDDDEVEIAPLTIIRTRGEIKELGAGRVSDDAYRAIEIMRGTNQEVGPPNAAAGSGGESGFQMSLSRAFSDDAMDDVRDGLIELYAGTGSIALESLSGIAERYGPVPVQRITPVPLGTRRSGVRTREILELSHDLVDGFFDLDAEYPPQPNLAKGQQWAEWASLPNPLILREEFRAEIIGDEHPEIFEARLMAQMAKQTPEALRRVLQLAAQLAGDADEQAQLESLANQQAIQGADGGVYPASMAVGLDAGMPQVGQAQTPVSLTGAGGLPSPGGSALGGAIGGPVAALNNAAAAGGMVPPDMPLGSV